MTLTHRVSPLVEIVRLPRDHRIVRISYAHLDIEFTLTPAEYDEWREAFGHEV